MLRWSGILGLDGNEGVKYPMQEQNQRVSNYFDRISSGYSERCSDQGLALGSYVAMIRRCPTSTISAATYLRKCWPRVRFRLTVPMGAEYRSQRFHATASISPGPSRTRRQLALHCRAPSAGRLHEPRRARARGKNDVANSEADQKGRVRSSLRDFAYRPARVRRWSPNTATRALP